MLEALSVTKASGSPLDLARSGVRFGKKHAIIAEILHPKNPRKETKTNDYSTSRNYISKKPPQVKGLEDEISLWGSAYFQVPCQFSGGKWQI